jgi:hypothetical protein
MLVFTTRVWLVFLVDAAYRAGLNPLSKQRVHRLVFLSNCLAPLFQATPHTAQIVKYKHGPFYPLIQWELDRLATMGILTIDNLKYSHDAKGWWVNADYGVGKMMEPVLAHCRQTEYGQQLWTRLLFEMRTTISRAWLPTHSSIFRIRRKISRLRPLARSATSCRSIWCLLEKRNSFCTCGFSKR